MKNLLDSQRDSFHSRIIILEGDGRSTVIDLLKVDHQMVVSNDLVHKGMITAINGLKNTDSEFWRYAVAYEKIPKPASETIPGKGKQVLWWFGSEPEPPKLET